MAAVNWVHLDVRHRALNPPTCFLNSFIMTTHPFVTIAI